MPKRGAAGYAIHRYANLLPLYSSQHQDNTPADVGACHKAAGSSETCQPVIESQEPAAGMLYVKDGREAGLAGIALPPAVAVGVVFCLLLLLYRYFSKKRKQKRSQRPPADSLVRLVTL